MVGWDERIADERRPWNENGEKDEEVHQRRSEFRICGRKSVAGWKTSIEVSRTTVGEAVCSPKT